MLKELPDSFYVKCCAGRRFLNKAPIGDGYIMVNFNTNSTSDISIDALLHWIDVGYFVIENSWFEEHRRRLLES